MICQSFNILGENKWDEVTQVHGLGGRASAGVEVEGLALLHRVEDEVQIPVGEKDSAPQKMVD